MYRNKRIVGGISIVVLDVDGVIRDYERSHDAALRAGFLNAGLEYLFKSKNVWNLRALGRFNKRSEAITALLAVTKAKNNLDHIIKEDNAEAFLEKLVKKHITSRDADTLLAINEGYEDYASSTSFKKNMRLLPNVKRALALIKKSGYKLCILTSSGKKTLGKDLGRQIISLFDMAVTKDDVKKQKPDPEGLKKIIKKFKVKPEKIIFIGDTEADIIAAKRAKCISGAVLSGMGTEKHLSLANPDIVFSDLLEAANLLRNKTE